MPPGHISFNDCCSSYGLKLSGLYRHRRGLGLHRVGYNGRRSLYRITKLSFHAKESPIRTRDESSILHLHSLGVWPKVIVRPSGHPLIQDSLNWGYTESVTMGGDLHIVSPSLPSTPRKVPSGHGTSLQSCIFIVWESGQRS